jgi:hypothetical protein
MTARTVVVQRGHVPRTTGATGTSGIDGDPTEQMFAIAAAEATRRKLEAVPDLAVRVIDADVPAASYQGDAFVAIHCDGNLDQTAHGASIGWQSPEGKAFGDLWKRAYTSAGWTRGWRADNNTPGLGGYYGVRLAIQQGNRVAICCECGFLTNRDDEALLTPPGGADRFASAVQTALLGYFGITTPSTEEDDVAGPRYLIVRGIDRGDRWVTDLAVAYPLGGRTNATPQQQETHKNLLVFLGAALVADDGGSIPMDQAQVDAIPKAMTANP